MYWIIFALGFFSSTNIVFAESKNSVFVVCKRQNEARWIRVYSSNDGKCKTVYSKDGYSQVVSSATFFSSCEGVLSNVRKNLEEGGFKCQEAQLAGVIEVK